MSLVRVATWRRKKPFFWPYEMMESWISRLVQCALILFRSTAHYLLAQCTVVTCSFAKRSIQGLETSSGWRGGCEERDKWGTRGPSDTSGDGRYAAILPNHLWTKNALQRVVGRMFY